MSPAPAKKEGSPAKDWGEERKEEERKESFPIMALVYGLFFLAASSRMDSAKVPAQLMEKWPRKKRHWCCQHEVRSVFTREAYRGACPHGFLFASGHEPWPIDWNALTYTRLATSAASNLAGVPAAVVMLNTGLVHEALVALATVLFSTLYHLGDVLDNEVLGLSPGSWHRLDNVCAVYAFQLSILALSGLHAAHGDQSRRTRAEALRTGLLVLTMWMQERGPWDPVSVVVPIASALLVAVLYHVGRGDVAQHHRDRMRALVRSRLFLGGCASVAVAVGCFLVALDETRDPTRLLHGCWHALASFGFLLHSCAVRDVDGLPRRGADTSDAAIGFGANAPTEKEKEG
jgi:hypothetical protein